jgi:hypothetical protein
MEVLPVLGGLEKFFAEVAETESLRIEYVSRRGIALTGACIYPMTANGRPGWSSPPRAVSVLNVCRCSPV